MLNVWVLDLRSQPPEVVASSEATHRETFAKVVGALSTVYSEPHFTLVSEVCAEQLDPERLKRVSA